MNKKCARPECGKTVYPLEELKCLDKVWHKQCFKCSVCGMTLTMKNYKGYEKVPYCEPHYPKTVASVVSDTPEMRRLAENTKNQSLIKYHEDFEKSKGHKIQIADDPEVQRCGQNMKVVSQANYHGEVERKEYMDKTRPPLQAGDRTSHHQEHGQSHQQPVANYYDHGAPVPTALVGAGAVSPTSANSNNGFAPKQPHMPKTLPPHNHPHHHTPQQQQQQQRMMQQHGQQQQQQQNTTPYSSRQQQGSHLVYSTEQGGHVAPQQHRNVGSISDYDPMRGQWGSISSTRPSAPLNSSNTGYNQTVGAYQSQRSPTGQQQQMAAAAPVSPTPRYPSGLASAGLTFRAIYDYTAADSDEVTFVEGDLVINCQKVDDGWMTGTVKRTNQWGMLPANYVEKVH